VFRKARIADSNSSRGTLWIFATEATIPFHSLNIDTVFAMSPRAELAQQILKTMANGDSVSTEDAIQLRNWANTPNDAMLALDEVARNVLGQKRNTMLRSDQE
jgi:hypothetical protein